MQTRWWISAAVLLAAADSNDSAMDEAPDTDEKPTMAATDDVTIPAEPGPSLAAPRDGDEITGTRSSGTSFHLTAEELRQRAGPNNVKEDLRGNRSASNKGKEPISSLEETVHVEEGSAESAAKVSADEAKDEGAEFECNICFEMAADPVVTLCGR